MQQTTASSPATGRCERCFEPLPGGPRGQCALCGMQFSMAGATQLVRASDGAELVARPRGVRALLSALGRAAPRNHDEDSVSTEMVVPASPVSVWNNIQFYEEVKQPPPLVLRWLLPTPIRTEGTKQDVAAVVRCVYRGGFLIKKITDSRPGGVIEFDVLKQALGIEGFVTLGRGSYQLFEQTERTTRVVLTTCYRGHLRPRVVWRPVERWLAHRMHRHILTGMRIHLTSSATAALPLPVSAPDSGDLGAEPAGR